MRVLWQVVVVIFIFIFASCIVAETAELREGKKFDFDALSSGGSTKAKTIESNDNSISRSGQTRQNFNEEYSREYKREEQVRAERRASPNKGVKEIRNVYENNELWTIIECESGLTTKYYHKNGKCCRPGLIFANCSDCKSLLLDANNSCLY